jgi:cysteine synthase A
MIANALGYKSVVVMPQTQSKEKIELLDIYGADLKLVKATSYDDENHYVHTAARLAEKLNQSSEHGAIWARQFDNLANKDIHYRTTGAEIWQQTEGKVDGFICAVGTGGTLAGVSAALKERNPNIKIGLADPMGSSLYNHYTHGKLEAEGGSITEGIGIGIITDNLRGAEVDHAFQIPDEIALPCIFNLLKHEGLCLGGSSGINVAGAIALAKELGPGHTIVTILCDYGHRYQSKLFNPAFLRRRKLPTPDWIPG